MIIYKIEEYSQDLYNFLKQKKNSKNNIIAHSLGCLVLYYCLMYNFKKEEIKDYVNNIIFLAPGIGVSNLTIPLNITYNLLIKGNFGSEKDIRNTLFCKYTNDEIIINCYKDLEKSNCTNLLDVFVKSFFYKEIETPILFIYGKYDKISPSKTISNIAYLFKEFQYKEFNSGHNLMLDYNWEDILEYILNYIKSRT